MVDFPLAPLLPDSILAQSRQLPPRLNLITLSGAYVELAPLVIERDIASLWAVSNGSPITLGERSVGAYDADALVWRYMSGGPFANPEDMAAFYKPIAASSNGLCLCVKDLATGTPVGVATFMNNFPEHLKVELGNIWYGPIAQRTHANTESTYLMLKHAFSLGYRRVEWKCDALNERSRRSALRMGFTFEGIQQQHFIIKGRNRDTAWFRILDSEWDRVQQVLRQLLDAG